MAHRLFRSAERHADRAFLVSKNNTADYQTAWGAVLKLARPLAETNRESQFVGILSQRGEFAYRCILSALAAGRTYVPLNPRLPDTKLADIIDLSGLTTICVGNGLVERVAAITQRHGNRIRLLCEEEPERTSLGDNITWEAVASFDVALEAIRAPKDYSRGAYLFFTSGSTGEPKGVLVSHDNVLAYLDFVCGRFKYGPDDVHSQTFELSFDLSVHDLACAWTTGGALVPLVGGALLAPGSTIKATGITCWFSVPSVGLLLDKQTALSKDSLPSLRVSLFCGEALPAVLAAKWRSAAPRSVIENLYGPTEATIAITHYTWDDTASAAVYRRGLVPIGRSFPGQRAELIDPDTLKMLAPGAGFGELVLSGSQVTAGYHRALQLTETRFLHNLTGDGAIWYRTGDLVERDEEGCLHFAGRLDQQVKMNGYRIELAEIEQALRRAAESDNVAVIPWPSSGGPVQQLIAVIAGAMRQRDDIRRNLSQLIPDYMMPRQIELWDNLPININGKIDRRQIAERISNRGPVG